MRLVFAGTPGPAVPVLRALIESNHEVCAVLTRPDARQGRGRTLRPSEVSQCAQEHGIEVLTPTTLRAGTPDGDDVRRRLTDLAPECIPVVAYGQLVPRDLLDLPTHGWVNLHFSLLPRWRGASPVQYAIAAGDEETGISVFRIDEGLDTGELLAMQQCPFPPEASSAQVLELLSESGAPLMVSTMDALAAGTCTPRAQVGEATYAPKLSSEDAHLDLTAPAEHILRSVRAYNPHPGAWVWGDEAKTLRVKIGEARTAEYGVGTVDDLAPGQLLVTKNAVYLGTGSTPIQLAQVQVAGKKMMDAAAWARGAHGWENMRWH